MYTFIYPTLTPIIPPPNISFSSYCCCSFSFHFIVLLSCVSAFAIVHSPSLPCIHIYMRYLYTTILVPSPPSSASVDISHTACITTHLHPHSYHHHHLPSTPQLSTVTLFCTLRGAVSCSFDLFAKSCPVGSSASFRAISFPRSVVFCAIHIDVLCVSNLVQVIRRPAQGCWEKMVVSARENEWGSERETR